MKTLKYNLIPALLLCVTMVFSQSRTQKSSELFYVNNDVIVEIRANHSDVKVEHWNKNEVLVETILSIDGVSPDEAEKYFDSWEIEALGNKNKVVIKSMPSFGHHFEDMDLDIDMDFDVDFDFEPVVAFALEFDSLSYPTPPVMPKIVIEHLNQIQWDQEAYEKDKEKYLAEFEKQQEEWANEMEEKFEPQMEEYEKEMEAWEKDFAEKYEPKMKAYEKEMEKWQKDFEKNIEPQLKKHEKRMKEKEKEMEIKFKKIEKRVEEKHEKTMKMGKKIVIKIPENARVKVNTNHGSIILPDGVKRIN